MKYGDFQGKVIGISVSISEERPAIITRVKTEGQEPQQLTHMIRLSSPDSQRIGFDELRSAFPTQLANLNDKELLTHLISKTNTFTGLPVTVGVEQQMKNGVVQKNRDGAPFYNVRLRSAVHDLPETEAGKIAENLLAGLVQKRHVEDAFAEHNV